MSGPRALIAGVYEYPDRVVPDLSALEIKALCGRRALDDAGLTWSDVDGVYDAGETEPAMPGIGLCEYLGLSPDVVDTTSVGGASYEFHVARAAADIAAGRVRVALITYGSVLRRRARAGGLNTDLGEPYTPVVNLERPYGLSLVGNYALAAQRHSYEYGTKPEMLAEIACITRRHALRNPVAVAGLEQLGVKRIGPLTVDDVLGSRPVADPLRVLDCCLVTDGGGAVVVVSDAVARGTRSAGVQVLGYGEAVQHASSGHPLTETAAGRSGRTAFGQAGVTPADIDVAMLYDSFTITVAMVLEDLGFCAKGEGGEYAASGVLAFDAPGGPALNTDGGGLSSTHPGMRGLFLLIEATRQLRGESTAQVESAELAVVQGIGGYLSTRHAAGTVVLGTAR